MVYLWLISGEPAKIMANGQFHPEHMESYVKMLATKTWQQSTTCWGRGRKILNSTNTNGDGRNRNSLFHSYWCNKVVLFRQKLRLSLYHTLPTSRWGGSQLRTGNPVLAMLTVVGICWNHTINQGAQVSPIHWRVFLLCLMLTAIVFECFWKVLSSWLSSWLSYIIISLVWFFHDEVHFLAMQSLSYQVLSPLSKTVEPHGFSAFFERPRLGLPAGPCSSLAAQNAMSLMLPAASLVAWLVAGLVASLVAPGGVSGWSAAKKLAQNHLPHKLHGWILLNKNVLCPLVAYVCAILIRLSWNGHGTRSSGLMLNEQNPASWPAVCAPPLSAASLAQSARTRSGMNWGRVHPITGIHSTV